MNRVIQCVLGVQVGSMLQKHHIYIWRYTFVSVAARTHAMSFENDSVKESTLLDSAYCAARTIAIASHNFGRNKSNVFCNITQLLYDNCHPKFGRYVVHRFSFISSKRKVLLNVSACVEWNSTKYIDFDL